MYDKKIASVFGFIQANSSFHFYVCLTNNSNTFTSFTGRHYVPPFNWKLIGFIHYRVGILKENNRAEFLLNKIFYPICIVIIFLGILRDVTEDKSPIYKQFENDDRKYDSLLSQSPIKINNDTSIESQSLEHIYTSKRKSKALRGKVFLKNSSPENLIKNQLIARQFFCTNPDAMTLMSNDYTMDFFVITKMKNRYTTLNHIVTQMIINKSDCQIIKTN